MNPDIRNRKHIEMLIDLFYKQVVVDEVIGHFFTEVVELDWNKHIPVMYDFWETTLLGKMKYKGNPMLKHIDLNRKEALMAPHFDRWLELWNRTVNENFQGPMADKALKKANQIAELMKYKIEQQSLI